MASPFSTVRFHGQIVKVRRHIIETEEQAKDRAWYVAKHLDKEMGNQEKESRSRAWANEKYLGMGYNGDKNVR